MTIPSPSQTTMTTIYSLPSELIENILVYCAFFGYPQAIAALARTSKHFRDIAYNSGDQHLWREAFLSVFDDPREAIRVRDDGRLTEPDYSKIVEGPSTNVKQESDLENSCYARFDRLPDDQIDWVSELKGRIRAANYLRRSATDPGRFQALQAVLATRTSADASTSVAPPTYAKPQNDPELREVLAHLLRTLLTSAPYPSSCTLSYPTPPQSSNLTFPSPTPVLACTTCAATSSHRVNRSGNISWVKALIGRYGFPPALTARLTANADAGLDAGFDESEVGRMFYRMVVCTGFVPVPQPRQLQRKLAGDTNREREDDEEVDENEIDETDGGRHPSGFYPLSVALPIPLAALFAHPSHLASARTYEEHDSDDQDAPPPDQTISAQERRARRLARLRVYRMGHAIRERHWGPYLSVLAGKAPLGRDGRGPLPFVFIRRRALNDLADQNAQGSDEEEEEEEEGVAVGGIVHFVGQGPDSPPPRALPPPPAPELLRPDWAYLAAVRMVIEANLMEVTGEAALAGLKALRGVRAGSGPREDGSVFRKAGEGAVEEGGNKSSVEEGQVDGWDWAGVEGVWRRCVCWMDYRDLILNNVHTAASSRFSDPNLQEAMRIIPLNLHVKSYSPGPPEWPGRPTIHVEGQAAGPDHLARRVWGSVGMIGEGAIRWKLTHCRREGDSWEDEWVMEGVQTGQVGSGMGVLGMWTGANHEATDPLGPTWMWKVRG